MSHHHDVGVLRTHDEFGSDPVVVAYGAGVDSTAMLIGLRDRRIDISLIMFADTGSEKPETTAYLPIIDEWLRQQGMPPIHRVKRRSPRAGDTSLHAECLRKSVLPSLAYGGHSCSLKWKVDPQWALHARLPRLGSPAAALAAWANHHQADRL